MVVLSSLIVCLLDACCGLLWGGCFYWCRGDFVVGVVGVFILGSKGL